MEEQVIRWIPELFYSLWAVLFIIGEIILITDVDIESYWHFLTYNMFLFMGSVLIVAMLYLIIMLIISGFKHYPNLSITILIGIIVFLVLKYALWRLHLRINT